MEGLGVTVLRSLPCMLRQLNADEHRAGYAPLSCNEAAALERLHHLIDTRRRDEEVPLDVGLSRRPAKASDVLGNESKVLELPRSRLQFTLSRRRSSWTLDQSVEFSGARFNSESRAI